MREKKRRVCMGKIIEGLWDCPFCGNKRIRAGQKTCPDCGHPQDENIKFYMPDEIKIQSYKDILDHYETVTETKTRSVIDHYEEKSSHVIR